VGDDGIEITRAEVHGGEPLHDVIGEPDGGVDADLQGGVVGDAGAIGVGDGDAAAFCEFDDLAAGSMNHDGFDAERAQDGEIDEDVGEILGGGDAAIDGDHKDPLPEAGHVLQNFSKIGDVHLERRSL